MAGPYLLIREGGWDLPSEGHGEPHSVGLGAPWLTEARLWLGGTRPPWPGSRVQVQQCRGLCLSPRPCQPLGRLDLGLGYGLGVIVFCSVVPLTQSSFNPMCTYPDVLLYISSFVSQSGKDPKTRCHMTRVL